MYNKVGIQDLKHQLLQMNNNNANSKNTNVNTLSNKLQDKVRALQLKSAQNGPFSRQSLDSQSPIMQHIRKQSLGEIQQRLTPVRSESQPKESRVNVDYGILMKEAENKQINQTDQWTERILKQSQQKIENTNKFIYFDKHKSCSILDQYNEDDEDIHLKKYTQLIQLNQNIVPKMVLINKKIKQFKQLKEQDHNQCASIVAKMKCFCLDNGTNCFDFYRCTDLITLKYMIFLLIQDINNNYKSVEPPKQFDQQGFSQVDQANNQIKALLKDTVTIIYEIIDEVQNKQWNSANAMNSLNQHVTQLQKNMQAMEDRPSKSRVLQTSHRLANSFVNINEGCTTPLAQQRSSDIGFFNEGTTQSQKRYNDTDHKPQQAITQSSRIISFQIDELNIKNQLLNKMTNQANSVSKELLKSQEENRQLLKQIADITADLQQQQKVVKQKEIELKSVNENFKKFEENYEKQKSDKDQYFKNYQTINFDYKQLKESFDDLQKSNLMMHKEYQNMKVQIAEQSQGEIQLLKNKRDEEVIRLSKQLNEKQLIISTILDDANYMGNIVKQVIDQVVCVHGDKIPNELLQLQRELYLQEPTFNQKYHTLSQFQQNLQLLGDSNIMNNNSNSNTNSQSNNLNINNNNAQQLYDLGDNFNLSMSQISTNDVRYPNTNIPLSRVFSASNIPSRKTSVAFDQLSVHRTHGDLLGMLLMQCDAIEKLIE